MIASHESPGLPSVRGLVGCQGTPYKLGPDRGYASGTVVTSLVRKNHPHYNSLLSQGFQRYSTPNVPIPNTLSAEPVDLRPDC